MRRIAFALLLVLLPGGVARADCQSGIAAAMQRARAFPPSAGRAALMEQIQRADVAHHEDDEGECLDQLRDATDVMDRIDVAKRRAAAHEEPAKGASRP